MGFAHPDHLLARLTSKQVAEWMAYATLEDIGADREDRRFAMLMATINNRHRGKSERAKTPADYLEQMRRIPKPEQTPEQQWGMMRALLRRK